jgi:hypothetical protein
MCYKLTSATGLGTTITPSRLGQTTDKLQYLTTAPLLSFRRATKHATDRLLPLSTTLLQSLLPVGEGWDKGQNHQNNAPNR